MHLTRFTDYSIRVLLLVATSPQGRSTISEAARAFGISVHHLVKVVNLLGHEGLLVNTRGRGGGVRLAVAPSQIRLGRVVRATEGKNLLAECFAPGSNGCAIAGACRFSGVLRESLDAFFAVLDRYTLQDLLDNPSGIVAVLHRHELREETAAAMV